MTVESDLMRSALARYFSPARQEDLLEEDYVAGRNVASILIAVVGSAMITGLAMVMWIAFFAR